MMTSSLSYIYQLGSNIPSQALKFTKKVVTHPITTFVIGLPFEQWFHEKGHCLTAGLLFTSSPRINYICGVIPGTCSYAAHTLSVLGTRLGYNNADILITAAGPFAEVAILTSIAACSSKSVAKRLLPFSCFLNLYSLTILFPGAGGGDFKELLEHSIIAYGTVTIACVLSTAFIALRAFKREQEKIVSKTE